MASIKIHSDLYNFRRTIKGFTTRQIKAFALALACAVGICVFLWYVCGVYYIVSLSADMLVALPILAIGVFPLSEVLFGLPGEELLQRSQDLAARGNTLSWHGESIEPLRGERSREYRKKVRSKGAECI